MIITGTQSVTVDVKPLDLATAMIQIINTRYNISCVDGIDENGRMYEVEEYYTSHAWYQKEDRGEPTEEQRTALQVREFLKGMKL